MVKVRIVCVGKVKEKYFCDAINEYLKRLSRFAEVTVREVKEENFNAEPTDADVEKILYAEGERIKKELKGKVYALAIEGQKLSSNELSRRIRVDIDRGEGEFSFVIGGSYGIAEDVKRNADGLISFSPMTFPHTLARVMLLEQIYRAFMIDAGAKYHK